MQKHATIGLLVLTTCLPISANAAQVRISLNDGALTALVDDTNTRVPGIENGDALSFSWLFDIGDEGLANQTLNTTNLVRADLSVGGYTSSIFAPPNPISGKTVFNTDENGNLSFFNTGQLGGYSGFASVTVTDTAGEEFTTFNYSPNALNLGGNTLITGRELGGSITTNRTRSDGSAGGNPRVNFNERATLSSWSLTFISDINLFDDAPEIPDLAFLNPVPFPDDIFVPEPLPTDFNFIPNVPVPAAGWALLAGIGSLGALRRFKRSRA